MTTKLQDFIMSDAAPASPAKKATKKASKPKKVAAHPPTSQMVNAAIRNLKERKGSSLAAIKKYIAANYKVDVAKLAPFIRKYLKKAVADGKLIQAKGTGAAGSFKLAAKAKEEKPKKAKKPKAKKPKKAKTPKKAKKPKAKKPKAKKPKKAKSPKKAAKPKKAKKSPKKAAKPKAKKPAKKAAKK